MSFIINTDTEKIQITDENFHEYFFDVRTNKPKKGQVLAKFTAVAEFVDGQGKRDIMYLLSLGKIEQAIAVMRKIHGVKELDCYKILKEICNDMLTLELSEVEKKTYEFTIQLFFYTQRDYVPKSPNWETIPLLEYDKEAGEYKSRIDIL